MLLYVKNFDEAYTYKGTFSGRGRFGKIGVGTLTVSNVVEQTYAGGIEKKTPDDGNEGDLTVLN